MSSGQSWDEYLFKGTAHHYVRGRQPYADGLAEALHRELNTTGSGMLVDVGSGPGTLALLLATQFSDVLAVEPDRDMAAIGMKRTAAQTPNVRWRVQPAEDLQLTAGSVDVAVFGQSFHWVDRPLVASRMRSALRPGGHLVLVSDVKDVAAPSPVPMDEIKALVQEYVGADRRAGTRTLPHGTPDDEEEVLARAGFVGPRRVVVDSPGTVFRDVDSVVADVYSRSNSAQHLFGERVDEFDRRLHALLVAHVVDGGFTVDRPATDVRIWVNPDGARDS